VRLATRLLPLVLFTALSACKPQAGPAPTTPTPPTPTGPGGLRTLSIVGTNDLHGHVEALPILAGYLDNLRAARRRDNGAVVLVDAGDMFQGTLESNLDEGAPVVAAYNALRYDAAAIGNHEFDFGPVGDAATPTAPHDDPRGALKARARQARFPFLAANIVSSATGQPPDWPNVRRSFLVDADGIAVGIVGATTMDTPHATVPANFAGLAMRSLPDALTREATALRQAGAAVVIAVAHAGGNCASFADANDLSSCEVDSEIFAAARAMPPGLIDVIVAGHTHAGVAHVVNDTAIIESFSYGTAFGRVDLTVDAAAAQVIDRQVFAPQRMCKPDATPCVTSPYEGADVVASAQLKAVIAPAQARARDRKRRPLGVRLLTEINRAYDRESPLGNLFTDLMRQARPEADVAITNGGGLRAALPAGPLTYGALYEAMPFDNRLALLELTGQQLRQVIADNLRADNGILSVSGIRARASCRDGVLQVTAARDDGRPVRDDDRVSVVTSDFLASGGDRAFHSVLASAQVTITGELMRDAMASALQARGGELRTEQVYDPTAPRLQFEGTRPVRCPVKSPSRP
jgi:2',3'-cyclic-nucleotide 2'-phosphodiesterase (5'-nucleotidase family)